MLEEKHYAPMNRYASSSDTSTTLDAVEWFAKNKGITNLDDPSTKVRTIIEDANKVELARQQAKKAGEAKAQDEFLDAMLNLGNGTAVLRQKKERTPVVTGKAKAVKTKRDSSKDRPNAAVRRAKIIKALNAGSRIKLERKKGAAYQAQYIDIRWIIDNHKMNIKRIKSVSSSDSYFVLDKFARYQAPEAINGAAEDKDKLLTALLSKKLVLASDVKGTNKLATATVLSIATQHDLDVYTVFDDSRKTVGWIYILDEEKRKAKIHKLGDMLQALDHLKEKKEKAGQ